MIEQCNIRLPRYRWFAVLYLLVCFLLFPSIVFALSMAGWKVMTGVSVPVITLIIFITTVNIIQVRRPNCLPHRLQNWNFLPIWMTSLQPMDDLITSVILWCGKTKGNFYCYEPHIVIQDEVFLVSVSEQQILFLLICF